MKLVYRREGGLAYFPGLSRPLHVDTASLPPEQGRRLEELCAAARLLDRAAGRPPSPGHPDAYSYTLTVQEGRRRRTVRLSDPLEERELQELVDFLEGLRPSLSAGGEGEGRER